MTSASELMIGLVLPASASTQCASPANARPTDMKYRHARLLINGQTPSELLGERLRDTAEVMGGMLKVNAFLNHQVDCHLMSVCGHELARRFRGLEITKVVTGFGSGMMPAQSCAMHLRVPLVFATSPAPLAAPGVTVLEAEISELSEISSNRKKSMFISTEFLGPSDRVLLVDDMLSKGGTIACLAELVRKAGAVPVGAGFLIEKEYEGGRKMMAQALPMLRPNRIESLVRIRSVENGLEIAPDEDDGNYYPTQ